jgi:hypothetical protein
MRRPQLTHATALLLALACATSGSPAGAQQPASPVTAAMDKADELYRQGNDAYKQNRLKDAYNFYRDAWNLKKSYDIAGNLGAVELAINMPRDAAEHLLHSLRQFPANGKPEARDKTRQRLEEALKQIGTLVIKANVDGADILIDGKSIGKAPLEQEVFVEAGARRVEAKFEGYESAQQQLQVGKGSTHQVALKLKKSAPPPPVVVTPTRPSWTVPVIVVGASLTVASIGTGIGLMWASGDKGTDADNLLQTIKTDPTTMNRTNPCPAEPRCASLKDLRADHDTFNNVAIGTFVLGGVFAAATVSSIFLLNPKRSGTESDVRVAPAVGPTSQGLFVTGTF